MKLNEVKFSYFHRIDDALVGDITINQGFNYYAQVAKHAEDLGYRTVFFPDHFMLPNTNAIYECWTLLTALAVRTERLRVCSMVTPISMYYPGVLARRVATLDHITGGRVMFGAGCGWYPKDFTGYGHRFDSLKVRARKMIEGLELIRALWTTEGPVTYHGKYYCLEGGELLPKPIQKPHPPVWIGGASHRLLEITARYAQGWIPYEMPPDILREKLQILEELTKKNNRSLSNIEVAHAFRSIVTVDSKEAKREMERIHVNPDTYEEVKPITKARGRLIVGSPEDCVEQLKEYLSLGIKHFVIGIQPPQKALEGLRIYAKQIIPDLT